MSSHWVFHATLLALGSYGGGNRGEQVKKKERERYEGERPSLALRWLHNRNSPSAGPPAYLLTHYILCADLKEQLLAVDVVDQESVVLFNHGQFVARGAHVQAAHGRRQLEQRDGKLVVDKDLQDLRHTHTHS